MSYKLASISQSKLVGRPRELPVGWTPDCARLMIVTRCRLDALCLPVACGEDAVQSDSDSECHWSLMFRL